MAKSGARALAFVDDFRARCAAAFARECAELEESRARDRGLPASRLAPWELAYRAERLRRARYDFDEEELRPYLPMDRVAQGLERAVRKLEGGSSAAHDAAEAILTTDRVPKLAARAFYAGDRRYVVGGIAKGSGMIAPNLATMLAFTATDAPMSLEELQRELAAASDETFNMISVDGDMSTNDAVYAFAPHGAGSAPDGFGAALRAVTRDLALAMVRDGEGATKTLAVEVSGAETTAQARAIARAIINSNLVKTALFGEDPNWGRIVAAAGSARAGLDPHAWSLALNGKAWVDRGALEILSEAEAHRELEGASVCVGLDLGIGDAAATGWGCDLSRDYVRINASYRT